MVLPLLALPAELQASVMRLVSDVTTAGRLAQASRVCGQLLQHFIEAKRNELRAAAASRHMAGSQRAEIHATLSR